MLTVTWMRLLARLHFLTGERRYFDRVEVSAYNALYGSVNVNMIKHFNKWDNSIVDPLPFDSYSPLYNNRRGTGVGGIKRFAFGGFYACCACIAAAGIALLPLLATLVSQRGITVNSYLPGRINAKTPAGNALTLNATSDYPAALDYRLALTLDTPETFTLSLRLPDFAEGYCLTVNGEAITAESDGGYLHVSRLWQSGDVVTLSAEMPLKTLKVGRRTAFTRGPIVLTRDLAKDTSTTDLAEEISLQKENGEPIAALLTRKGDELLRLSLKRADGKPDLLLTDYATAGKDWNRPNSNITVWFNINE